MLQIIKKAKGFMPLISKNITTDLRGMSQLTIDAILGVTDIAESLQHTIIHSPAQSLPDNLEQKRTTGITGMVYRNVRGITKLVGYGIDAPLSCLSAKLDEADSPPVREAALAALNGVLGDHLVASNNPLAISMQLRRDGKPLTDQMLAAAIQEANGKLVIMVHGVCMNDLQWNRNGHNHGAALARDLNHLPLYLHYNSGLHVSENGRSLSNLLESLTERTAQPLNLTIIAFSMGGLVSRSAVHYGKVNGRSWPTHLKKLIFLGTPHHGAPLEKGGNWIDNILTISPYSVPFSRLGKIRSSGFTDLRYGNVVAEDWQGRDRFELSGDQRTPVPLPPGIDCYTIAAITKKPANKTVGDFIGDGLVPVKSALGQHKNARLNLWFPDDHQWIGRDMNHIDLLNHPGVYATLKKWLETDG